jgi:hypothetical protein
MLYPAVGGLTNLPVFVPAEFKYGFISKIYDWGVSSNRFSALLNIKKLPAPDNPVLIH